VGVGGVHEASEPLREWTIGILVMSVAGSGVEGEGVYEIVWLPHGRLNFGGVVGGESDISGLASVDSVGDDDVDPSVVVNEALGADTGSPHDWYGGFLSSEVHDLVV